MRQLSPLDTNRLYTLAPEMMGIANFDGQFVHLNPSWERTLGFSTADLMAVPYLDFVHPEDRERTVIEMARLARGEPVIHFENRYRCIDESYRWLSWNCAPYLEEGLIYFTARDVTVMKEQEERLDQHFDWLWLMSRVDSELSRQLNLEYLLDISLDQLLRISQADAGFIALLDEDDQLQWVKGAGGYPVMQRPPYPQCDEAINERKPLYIEEPQSVLPNIKFQLIVPLIAHGIPIGVFCIETRHDEAFSLDAIAFVQMAGNYMAVAISNAKLVRSLEKREEKYRLMVETAHEMVLRIEADGLISFCNPAAERITGYSRKALIGKHFLELLLPNFQGIMAKNFRLILEGQTQQPYFEVPMMTKAGETVWLGVSIQPIIETGTAVEGFRVIARDITERKHVESKLRRSEELMRATLTSIDDLVFVLDKDGNFINYYQPEHKDELYVPPDQFLGNHFSAVMPPEVAAPLQLVMNEVATTHKVQQFEYALDMGENAPAWYEAKVSMHRDDHGDFDGVTIVARNITQRKRAELEVQRSRNLYRTLARHLPKMAVMLFDRNLRYSLVEGHLLTELGYDRNEMEGQLLWEIFPPDMAETLAVQYLKVFEGEIVKFDWHPSERHYVVQIIPIHNSSNEVVQGLLIMEDVSEIRQAELYLRRVLSSLFMFAGVLTPDGTVLEINQAMLEPAGLKLDDVLGKPFEETFWWAYSPDPQARLRDAIEQAAHGERVRYDAKLRLARDHYMWVDFMLSPMVDEDGAITHLVPSAVDITERRQLADKFQKVFEASPDSIMISTIDEGRYIDVNEGFTRDTGHLREEAIGKTSRDIRVWATPEDRDRFVAVLRAEGRVRDFETQYRAKDGTVRTAIMSSAVIDLDEKPCLLTISRDITERKQQEIERENLIQELNAFASTVAHDLKNPLNLVAGYASLLLDDPDLSPPSHDMVDIVAKTAKRMAKIIDELLKLASLRKDIQPVPIDTAALVHEAKQRLLLVIEEKQAEIVQPHVWPIALGYGPWIEEVWSNYISNAIKYGGTPPQIELGATELADGMIRFWARDNGQGMTAEEQAKLFQQFSRLHHVKIEGHGLGLSIVKRIVERLGGEVGVESKVGQGSTFWFTLPAFSASDDGLSGW